MSLGTQQSMFSFDGEDAGTVPTGAGASAQRLESPPDTWAGLAVDACFGGQKTRWKALAEDVRKEVLAAMWGYACARQAASAAPLRAFDAEPALLGWLNDSPAAAHARVLTAHMLAPSDIPAPAQRWPWLNTTR
ncbi:MAG: hypothetical protein K0Q43_199 [Ramlibacter sp.]|nr:hypothetical protein [Ramlibacter sp.]